MSSTAAPAAARRPGSASDPIAGDRPQAQADRLAADIERFAALSEPGDGVSRLAYTAPERRAHEVFTEAMREHGLSVHTDAAGNTIAERAGTDPSLPALGSGSHLDSVPHGGRFDGIAGVVACLEIVRLLDEHEMTHRHPLRFVVFAGEEGARFGQACTGSRIAAGLTRAPDLHARADADGVTIAAAMTDVGLDPGRAGEARWRPEEWAAFVELHIEQGNVLEELGIRIGVVDLISGSTRMRLDISGRASHTGGTPMHLRADALTAAAEVVLLGESLALDSRHHGTRITVGRLDVEPGSITTIPGHAALYVDVRDVDADRQRSTATELLTRSRALCDARGVSLRTEVLGDTSPVVLPIWVRQLISGACDAAGEPYRVMPSGASHDAQMVNHVIPTGMIFVPSRGGLSHTPAEWTSAADLATGATTLLAVLRSTDDALSPAEET